MMTENLENKLENSEAVFSLRMERQIQHTIDANNWTTIRSPYFLDQTSKKYRELDIIGRRLYNKPFGKHDSLSSNIILLVECKSLSNYHIIADGQCNNYHPKESNVKLWYGYDLYHMSNKLISILNKSSIPEQDKAKVLKMIEKWCFPNDSSVVADCVPELFSHIDGYSSFRETNIGSSKELENSVLWKSFHTLNSAAGGYEWFEWDRFEDDFLSSLEYALRNKSDLKSTLKNLEYSKFLQHHTLHKILVIDSKLWVYNESMEAIPYFRLIQRNVYGHKEEWIDVVNINSFDNYIQEVSNHYDEFANKNGMMKWRFQSA